MKVLLSGGAGFIGSHTCLELINAGYDVIVGDNYSNSCPVSIQRVEELTGKKIPQYEVDFCDKKAVEELFDKESDIGAVIHFAGLKAVGESVSMPLEYYRNNLDSTMTLLEVMKQHAIFKIVFSSSATVYAAAPSGEMTEDMPTGCINPYGWTKYMNEQILRDVAVTDDRWSVILLRYFNPVGAHESGRIGEDPNGIPNNLLPRVMQNALGIIPVLGIFGDDYPTPDGTCIRDYIHVVDLARGHLAALKFQETFCGCEAINLGTGTGYSVRQILDSFERVNGVKLNYTVQPRRAGDAPVGYANPEKAKRLLHWEAQKTLDDMCRDAWRWQVQNPNGYSDAK